MYACIAILHCGYYGWESTSSLYVNSLKEKAHTTAPLTLNTLDACRPYQGADNTGIAVMRSSALL
jgi:hypothetical protein